MRIFVDAYMSQKLGITLYEPTIAANIMHPNNTPNGWSLKSVSTPTERMRDAVM